MNDTTEPQRNSRRDGILFAAVAATLSIIAVAALLFFTTGSIVPHSGSAAGDLPTHLSDAEFWGMVTGFSEPGGYFRSDNFLSNETGYQEVIPHLRKALKPNGVYLGVGPEQNFTYLASLQPRMAFILDIRRQNMIEHLLYKAFIELSSDRADFLSRLFARPRPPELGRASTAESLFRSFDAAAPDRGLFEANIRAALSHLANHKFSLTADDQKSIRKIYEAFFESGGDLSYTFDGAPLRAGRGNMPSYSTLMTATDGQGKNWSYLATEEQFAFVQQLERNNLIVPLVGDFAGDKAIRAVAQYLNGKHAQVTMFYVSNVEQYLFQQDQAWNRFYSNVATLPVDSTGVFIRSIVGRQGRRGGDGRGNRSFALLRTTTSPIEVLVQAFQTGQIHAYYDVVERSVSPD